LALGEQWLERDITYEHLLNSIQKVLEFIKVDESWYTKTYPHVVDAIERGEHNSAQEHFVEKGYFEGLLPSRDFSYKVLGEDERPLQ